MTGENSQCARSVDSEHVDRTLDALAHHRRRSALYHLRDADDSTSIASLADAIADGGDDVERVVASLHHRHVPKLADAGVVHHDARSGDVRYAADSVVDSWLDRLAEVERRE